MRACLFRRARRTQKRLAELQGQVARIDGLLRAANESYGARLLDLETEVIELRRRLSQLERERAGPVSNVHGGSTVLHDEYRAIGEEVEACLDQYVMYLAMPAGSGHSRREPEAARLVAHTARQICDALFAPDGVDVDAVLAVTHATNPADQERLQLAARASDEVNRLRREARAQGLDHAWSFAAHLEAPINEAFQRAFGTCDPAGTVKFVVFPAFLVEGVVLIPQRVFTSL